MTDQPQGCARTTGSVIGGEATPADWEPSEITLKPGPDLVGHVWEVWQPSIEA